MTALDALIARYRAVNGFVASDAYEDRDEEAVIDAALAERRELVDCLKELADYGESGKVAEPYMVERAKALLSKHQA